MSCLGLEYARVSYLESLEVGGKSPLTLASYRRHLVELVDWLRENGKPPIIGDIQSSDIRGFLLYLGRRPKRPGFQHRNEPEGGLAPETLRAYYGSLSAFF
jgi:site-specific recombinase XerC